jgi:hypothetical protein
MGGAAAVSPATTTQRLLVDAKLEWESERACFALTSQLMDHLRTQREALRRQAQVAVAAATRTDATGPSAAAATTAAFDRPGDAASASGGGAPIARTATADGPDAPLFALEAATVRAHFHNAVAADRARADHARLQHEVTAMTEANERTRGDMETLKENLRVVLERKQQLDAAVAARRRELRATIEEVRANVRVRTRLGAAGFGAGDVDMAAMMLQPGRGGGAGASGRRRR